jgi:hypothetical protein
LSGAGMVGRAAVRVRATLHLRMSKRFRTERATTAIYPRRERRAR